jgi:hypothetical protein
MPTNSKEIRAVLKELQLLSKLGTLNLLATLISSLEIILRKRNVRKTRKNIRNNSLKINKSEKGSK